VERVREKINSFRANCFFSEADFTTKEDANENWRTRMRKPHLNIY